MSCRTAQEHRAKLAASVLDDVPAVIAVDALEPSADPTARWTVELVAEPRADPTRCPPEVHAILGEYGLGSIDTTRKGGVVVVEAIAP